VKRMLAKALAVVSVAALGATLVVATPAQAAGASIGRRIFLAADPRPLVGSAKILPTDRRINLAADTYSWRHVFREDRNEQGTGVIQNGRTIDLAAGWYHWNCDVFPESDTSLRYLSHCWLRRESTGTYAYTPTLPLFTWGYDRWNGILGTYFDWSSTLTRV
jgi:hypothetical protein